MDLGIDLGTSFVAAALSRPGQIEMATLGERSWVSPSVVFICEDGTVLTGDAAERRAQRDPRRAAREVKRRIGETTALVLRGTSYPAEALLGRLLTDVVHKVSEQEGARPDRIVLTHPPHWGPHQLERFAAVPPSAGLDQVRLVSESEAAAAYHGMRTRLADGDVVAVYDLGGGTFDATVLRTRPGGFDVLGAAEGIERLGGIDFDEAILAFVNHRLRGALDDLDLRDPRTATAVSRLRHDCVLAKEALTADTETTIPVLLPERHGEVRLTRSEFEDLVRHPIESTIGALHRALHRAQVPPAELAAVVLVGGSSRIPLVAKMISEELGRPAVVDGHPKYAVALGAALLARSPAPQQGRPPVHRGAVTLTVPPAGDQPPPSRGLAARRRGRTTLLAVAVTAVVLILGIVAWYPRSPAPAALTPPDPAAPASAPTLLSTSVANPTLGALIPVGKSPYAITVAPGGDAYLTCPDENSLQVIDTATNGRTAAVPVPGSPRFLAFTPDGRRGYVGLELPTDPALAGPAGHAVAAVDTASNTVVATIAVGGRPFGLAVTPDGRHVWVAHHDTGTISLIDTATNTVTSTITAVSTPHTVAFSPDGRRAYVTNDNSHQVSVIDTTTNQVTATLGVGPSPQALALAPDGKHAYVADSTGNAVSVLDTVTNALTTTIPVGKKPQSVALAPDGRHAYVANSDDDTVSVIATATNQITATVPVGKTPTSVAVRPDGRYAYVANTGSHDLGVLRTGT